MTKTNDAWEILLADVAGDPGILDGIRSARIQAEAGTVAYKLREDAGLSQAELAGKLNVPVSRIDDFEMGDAEGADILQFLRQIAAITGAPIDAELERIKSIQLESAF
jgi:transcriptional regulator with XRE-family HTH domain